MAKNIRVFSSLTEYQNAELQRPTLSGNGIFANTPIASGQGIIYVPSSAVNTYKTASGWSQYANIIVGI